MIAFRRRPFTIWIEARAAGVASIVRSNLVKCDLVVETFRLSALLMLAYFVQVAREFYKMPIPARMAHRRMSA